MNDQKWPLTFERIRGHWIGLGFGLVGMAVAAYRHIAHGGVAELVTPAAIVFTLLTGFAVYWGYRAVDYLSR